MFNVGGGELLIILFVALVVLGPDKLPDAARKIGNLMGEVKRMSQGFQDELKSAMDTPTKVVEGARSTMSTTSQDQSAQTPAAVTPAASPNSSPPASDDDIRPIDPTGARAVPHDEARKDDPAA